MPNVYLPSSLLSLTDGRDAVELDGATACGLLAGLESRYPRLAGWILDEHGSLRQHVAIFRDGERVELDTPLEAGSRLDVNPATTGGAPSADEADERLAGSLIRGSA